MNHPPAPHRTRSARHQIPRSLLHGKTVEVTVVAEGGKRVTFGATVRIDSAVELETLRNGGILQSVVKEPAG